MNLAEEMAKEVEAANKLKIQSDMDNLYIHIKNKALVGNESTVFTFYDCFSPHLMDKIIKELIEKGFEVKQTGIHTIRVDWSKHIKKPCSQCGEMHEVCQ
jgi:hypothetical protein